ncbi:hypothetical protein COOONC_24453 [Cooperia oncophora]
MKEMFPDRCELPKRQVTEMGQTSETGCPGCAMPKALMKFVVDVIIGTFLIVIGSLDRLNEEQCGAVLVISTCIPLLQDFRIAATMADVTTETTSCVSSPTDTAVISAYDISVIFATICLVALGVLLARKLNSSLYKPVLFHFVSTLLLLEIPLVIVISLKYASQSTAAIRAADATNLLVAIHCSLHSAYFIYNHEDYRVSFSQTESFTNFTREVWLKL